MQLSSSHSSSAPKPPWKQSPGLDIHRLDQAVQQFYQAALTPSRHKTYTAAERKYLSFCSNFSLPPYLLQKTFYVILQPRGPSRFLHTHLFIRYPSDSKISAGFPDPRIDHMPRLRQVLKGIRVQVAKNGRTSRPRLPITPSILYKLRKVWLEDNFSINNIVLWAASRTTFFGFCRSGEITVECFDPKIHLSLADLAVDNSLPLQSFPFN